MTVAFFSRRAFPVLDGAFRAPVNAGEALLTVVPPDGPFPLHHDVGRRAYVFTNAAGVAFFIGPKGFVHARDIRQRLSVNRRKNDILPQGAFFRRQLFIAPDYGRDAINFFERGGKFLLLFFEGNRAASGYVITGQIDGKSVG